MKAPQIQHMGSRFDICVEVIHFFICFLGKEKKTGVLEMPLQTLTCSLQQSGMLNCTVLASHPERGIYLSWYFLMYLPYFYLSKLKTKASVSHQPLLLNLEHGSGVLFRKVLFKSRLWIRNPALLGLEARLTAILIGWHCSIWISAGCGFGLLCS